MADKVASLRDPAVRLKRLGDGAVTDREHLELILARLGRRDPAHLADRLISRYGGFGAAVSASTADLLRHGLDGDLAADLQLIRSAAVRLLRGRLRQRRGMVSTAAAAAYCPAAMAFEAREQFRILFLDKKNALIADEVQQTGTVDHTPVYPREVVKRALELSATAIILVHNHPTHSFRSH